MKFSVVQKFDFPLELVLKAREERYNLIPELKKPDVFEKTSQGNVIRTKRRFTAAGTLPKSLKKFIPVETMEFIDHSTWDAGAGVHRWKIVSVKYEKTIRWQGTTRYEEHEESGGKKTRRIMEGEISVNIPFVGRQLEKIMADGFKNNFEKDYRTIVEAAEKMS
ncbi:MAG: DUF2505 family protein [bacterium]